MQRGFKVLSWICVVLGAASIVAGAATFVFARNLFDSRVFADRAAASLTHPGVSAYAAEQVASAVVRSNPDLIAVRPLIVAAASSIVETRAFAALVEHAAREAHSAALSDASAQIVLSIPDFQILLRNALEQASPELAAKVPKQVNSVLASLGRPGVTDYMIDAWRLGRRLEWLWKVLFPSGALLLILAVWAARNRRRTMVRAGASLVAGGILLATIIPASTVLAALIDQPLEREAVRGLIQTFLQDLESWGIFLAGLGILFAAGAASLLEHVDPLSEIQRFGRHLFAVPRTRPGRASWAAALIVIGTAAALAPAPLINGLIALGGVSVAYIGLRELFRLFAEKVAPHVEEAAAEPREFATALVVVGILVALFAIGWFIWRNPSIQPVEADTLACNGFAELCGKRLDEVVFAGAHNAMSNQSIPGWMFPHQEAGIPQQLRDGIRALLLDVHYGFPGGTRIKTDTSSDPMMDRVKAALGEEGFEAALRIRNRLVGVDEKRRELYLCHGLCELGAYSLESALRNIRDFMVSHPDEVLVLIIEDYVKPSELAAAFEQTGLEQFVYKGAGHPQWPTLKQLIESGDRLVVFIESGRTEVPWLRPAFDVFKETPYGFHSPGQFSCEASRGSKEGSMFLMNNWVETTPTPKPSNAAVVNSREFLLNRARICAQERGQIPNIIAVDFYRTGDLFQVVNELNGVSAPSL